MKTWLNLFTSLQTGDKNLITFHLAIRASLWSLSHLHPVFRELFSNKPFPLPFPSYLVTPSLASASWQLHFHKQNFKWALVWLLLRPSWGRQLNFSLENFLCTARKHLTEERDKSEADTKGNVGLKVICRSREMCNECIKGVFGGAGWTKDRDWNVCGCFGNFIKALPVMPEILEAYSPQNPPHPTPSCHVICHTFHSRQWVSSRRHQVFIRPRMLNFWWVLRPWATLPKKTRNSGSLWKFYLYVAALWGVQNFVGQKMLLIEKFICRNAKVWARF